MTLLRQPLCTVYKPDERFKTLHQNSYLLEAICNLAGKAYDLQNDQLEVIQKFY